MTEQARPRAAVILAAGKGTRMKSSLPKVMHAVGGRPMIDWSINLARQLGCAPIAVVVHPSQDQLVAHLAVSAPEALIAYQDPPLGTGHAVRAAETHLAGFAGDIAVLYGDSPLVPAAAIGALFAELAGGAAFGVLGFETDTPGLYGRLILSPDGVLEAIVEARDATAEQSRVRLCNSGVLAGRATIMLPLLQKIENNNVKGEYYLTDLIGLARQAGLSSRAVIWSQDDLIGCDSKAQLALAEARFQARRRHEAMEAGVTLIAPETVFFAFDTEIGPDAVIEPHVIFGPGVRVAEGARIRGFSHLEGADIAPGAIIGPFARLRPGARIGVAAHIGNFVEVKNVAVGDGAKANHLAYLGDGSVGASANIGAGTIFCNYDGFFKYETHIGAGAFIGSNSALVAPVHIGAGAYVGSGSVITEDVAPDALALARAAQIGKAGWAHEFRLRKSAEKVARGKKD